MSENKRERLNDLFSLYVGRRITSDELSELKKLVNSSGNDELDKPLRSLWINNEYPLFLPTEEQELRMTEHIEQAICKRKKRGILPWHKRFVGSLSRMAAILVIGLFTAISFYLYRDNRSLSVYRDNEITLRISNGQEAEFVLPDGTSVRLNSGSILRYANNFGKNNRHVNFSGEAFFEVEKDEKRPFIVHTNHMDIEVLGTTFNLYAYDGGDLVEMTLLTGSVKASSIRHPENKVIVKPDEKVVCHTLTGELEVRKANIVYETAWLNGELVFKSETLKRVMEKLERKYGIHIRYEGNSGLLEDRFSGRISKDNSIHEAMKILSGHYSLRYEQKNNDLFVLYEQKK
jgi:ferric-dicitrate binding protein FerR (iron transport regulator)